MKKSKRILAIIIVASAFVMRGIIATAQAEPSDKSSIDESIRPFQKIHVSQAELDDLRGRVLATKWPDPETVKDETQGVQLSTMQKLAKHWATEYDWRR